jgi:branched-chain amino acid transport system ATP-binding protein
MFGRLSVEENVVVALEWRGGGGGLVADLAGLPTRKRRHRDRLARVEEVLELCGIASLRYELAGRLTIGQARLVEMARALVDRPRLLLLDEPTSGLGEGDVELFGRLVREVRAVERCSILLVEHDVQFVMEECDRVVVLQLGEVIADGTPAEVSASAAVAEAYLG